MSSAEFRLERSLELSPDTKVVAETELRETPERVREALERLRELLKENKDLCYGDDDELLTIFLRPCKWYPESALALVSSLIFISGKSLTPQILCANYATDHYLAPLKSKLMIACIDVLTGTFFTIFANRLILSISYMMSKPIIYKNLRSVIYTKCCLYLLGISWQP